MIYYFSIILIILMMVNLFLMPSIQESRIVTANYSDFITETSDGKVEKVEEYDNYYLYQLKGDSTIYKTGKMNDPDLVQRLSDNDVSFTADIQEEQSPFVTFLLEWILPLVIAGALWSYLMRRMAGGTGNSMAFNMGKSNARVYVKSQEGIRFSDVAGEDEAKESLQEIVTYLHDPGKYKKIGATMPKGILLVGPPGTGKTMLAKAVAGEANVPFFSISGSEFVEMFVGMGASKVRDLFKQAKEKAPCIVFIDEINCQSSAGFPANPATRCYP